MDELEFLLELKFFIETCVMELNEDSIPIEELVEAGDFPVVYDEIIRRLARAGVN